MRRESQEIDVQQSVLSRRQHLQILSPVVSTHLVDVVHMMAGRDVAVGGLSDQVMFIQHKLTAIHLRVVPQVAELLVEDGAPVRILRAHLM